MNHSDLANCQRIALVSCVKTKRDTPAPAADLYVSALFRGMRRYAEQNADAWLILSAEHGLVQPDTVIAPYERTLGNLSKSSRAEWAAKVQRQLLDQLPGGATIIVLAGSLYRRDVVSFLQDHGFTVTVPMMGLSFGQQLAWLKRHGSHERTFGEAD